MSRTDGPADVLLLQKGGTRTETVKGKTVDGLGLGQVALDARADCVMLSLMSGDSESSQSFVGQLVMLSDERVSVEDFVPPTQYVPPVKNTYGSWGRKNFKNGFSPIPASKPISEEIERSLRQIREKSWYPLVVWNGKESRVAMVCLSRLAVSEFHEAPDRFTVDDVLTAWWRQQLAIADKSPTAELRNFRMAVSAVTKLNDARNFQEFATRFFAVMNYMAVEPCVFGAINCRSDNDLDPQVTLADLGGIDSNVLDGLKKQLWAADDAFSNSTEAIRQLVNIAPDSCIGVSKFSVVGRTFALITKHREISYVNRVLTSLLIEGAIHTLRNLLLSDFSLYLR